MLCTLDLFSHHNDNGDDDNSNNNADDDGTKKMMFPVYMRIYKYLTMTEPLQHIGNLRKYISKLLPHDEQKINNKVP